MVTVTRAMTVVVVNGSGGSWVIPVPEVRAWWCESSLENVVHATESLSSGQVDEMLLEGAELGVFVLTLNPGPSRLCD